MSPHILDDNGYDCAENRGSDQRPHQSNLKTQQRSIEEIDRRLVVILPNDGSQPDQENRADDEARSFDKSRHRPLPSNLRMPQAWRWRLVVSTQRSAFSATPSS